MSAAASDVAAALRDRLPGLRVKKLHKLLHLSQGHHLAAFGQPLFGESVSAWDMGPVVGRLWKHEQNEITGSAAQLTERELNTVGYVVSRYGRLSGRNLQILSHGQDPWRLADAGRSPGHSVRIEDPWLEAWFRQSDGDDDLPAPGWLAGAARRAAQPAVPDDPQRLLARLSP